MHHHGSRKLPETKLVRQAGAEGKRLRPTILLLMASTLSGVVPNPHYLTVDERPPNVHPEEVRSALSRSSLPAHLVAILRESAGTTLGQRHTQRRSGGGSSG